MPPPPPCIPSVPSVPLRQHLQNNRLHPKPLQPLTVHTCGATDPPVPAAMLSPVSNPPPPSCRSPLIPFQPTWSPNALKIVGLRTKPSAPAGLRGKEEEGWGGHGMNKAWRCEGGGGGPDSTPKTFPPPHLPAPRHALTPHLGHRHRSPPAQHRGIPSAGRTASLLPP